MVSSLIEEVGDAVTLRVKSQRFRSGKLEDKMRNPVVQSRAGGRGVGAGPAGYRDGNRLYAGKDLACVSDRPWPESARGVEFYLPVHELQEHREQGEDCREAR